MASPQPICQPNPDIAGVGIRTSVYFQNLLCVALSALYIADARVTDEEYTSIKSLSIGILLVGCGNLVSAFIQIKKLVFALNPYHAIIILNLGWINSVNLLTTATFYSNLCYWRLEPLRAKLIRRDSYIKMMLGTLSEQQQLLAKKIGANMPSFDTDLEKNIRRLKEAHNPLDDTTPDLVALSGRPLNIDRNINIQLCTTLMLQLDNTLKARSRLPEDYVRDIERLRCELNGVMKNMREQDREIEDYHQMCRTIHHPFRRIWTRGNQSFMALGIGHLAFMACFGLYFWSNLDAFGSQMCASQVFVAIFNLRIRVADETLKIVSLTVYSAIIAICVLGLATPFIFRRGRAKPRGPRYNLNQTIVVPDRSKCEAVVLYACLVFGALVDAAFIVNTELMVASNKKLVGLEESVWTFGQTLAVLVTIAPVWQAINDIAGMVDLERHPIIKKVFDHRDRLADFISGDTPTRAT